MTDEINPRERRLVLRLLGYWRQIAGERDWPMPADVNGTDIADMWPYCFLIDLGSGAPVYRFVGEYHCRLYGADPSGTALTAAKSETLVGRSSSYVQEVVNRRVPITYGGQFVDHEGRGLLYRSILLPLSADGKSIDSVFGGANCRELDQTAKP